MEAAYSGHLTEVGNIFTVKKKKKLFSVDQSFPSLFLFLEGNNELYSPC